MLTQTPHFLSQEAIRIAIKAVQEIRNLPTDKAQNMLRSCWSSHVKDYEEALTIAALGSEAVRDRPSGQQRFSRLVALVTLDAYFSELGDWGKMIERLERKLTGAL